MRNNNISWRKKGREGERRNNKWKEREREKNYPIEQKDKEKRKKQELESIDNKREKNKREDIKNNDHKKEIKLKDKKDKKRKVKGKPIRNRKRKRWENFKVQITKDNRLIIKIREKAKVLDVFVVLKKYAKKIGDAEEENKIEERIDFSEKDKMKKRKAEKNNQKKKYLEKETKEKYERIQELVIFSKSAKSPDNDYTYEDIDIINLGEGTYLFDIKRIKSIIKPEEIEVIAFLNNKKILKQTIHIMKKKKK